MPYPEAHVESSLPQLGSALRLSIQGRGLADFLRRSVQIRDLRCELGLPRRACADAVRRWLSGPHVFVKLGSGAHFDAELCEVAVPVEQAQWLVDRVLGGSGRGGTVPGKAGIPNAAERGVLAYFAARCVRACGADLRVQDVTPGIETAQLSHGVLWPLRIVASETPKLDLKLIFRDAADFPVERVSARLSLVDTIDTKELAELRPGDLLVADGWSLHLTAAGLSGLLELTVLGSEERVLVSLEANTLRPARGALSAREPDTAELVVSELPLDFAQLACLLSDECVPCPTPSEARLVARGEELARGRLVRFANQIALEVQAHGSSHAHGADARESPGETPAEAHSTR